MFIALYISVVISFLLAFCLTATIEKDFHIRVFISPYFGKIFMLCLGVIWLVVLMYYHKHYWLYNSKNIIKGKKSDEGIDVKLENSRFMEDDEMRKIFQVEKYSNLKNLSLNASVISAYEDDGELEAVFTHEAMHSLIIGTTGSGKTTTYVNNTLQILKELKNKPSMIVSDPKGELFKFHSKSLLERGYRVKVIDLRNPYNSVRWNPLERLYELYKQAHNLDSLYEVDEENGCYWMDGVRYQDYELLHISLQVKKQLLIDTVYEELNDICQVLCPITNKQEPMWESGAKNFILAVCLAMLEDSVVEGSNMTKDKFNFYSIMKVCTKTDNNCKDLLDYFKGRSPLSKCVSLSKQVLEASDKTRGSYLSTVFDKISIFADLSLCALTCENEIEFATLGEVPTVLFLKIPDEKETRHIIASMIILQAYKELVYKAQSYESLKLPRPVHFILDEFGNLPKINKLEQIVTVSRGRNIFLSLIVQSYAQLAKVYDEQTADIIKSNCNIQIFIGTADIKTSEEFSKKLGNFTVLQRSVGFASAKGEDINSNQSVKERPLMYASELQLLKNGNAIVTVFRHKPLKARFTPSYQVSSYTLIPVDEVLERGRYFDEEKAFYDIENRNRLIGRGNVRQRISSKEGMKRINLISEINYIMQDVLSTDDINQLENAVRNLDLEFAIVLLDKAVGIARLQDNKEKITLIEEETRQIRDFIIQNKKMDFNSLIKN